MVQKFQEMIVGVCKMYNPVGTCIYCTYCIWKKLLLLFIDNLIWFGKEDYILILDLCKWTYLEIGTKKTKNQ